MISLLAMRVELFGRGMYSSCHRLSNLEGTKTLRTQSFDRISRAPGCTSHCLLDDAKILMGTVVVSGGNVLDHTFRPACSIVGQRCWVFPFYRGFLAVVRTCLSLPLVGSWPNATPNSVPLSVHTPKTDSARASAPLNVAVVTAGFLLDGPARRGRIALYHR
jgi:hypothetical protein